MGADSLMESLFFQQEKGKIIYVYKCQNGVRDGG